MKRKWKCPVCNDIVISNDEERHCMDECKCHKTAVDLEKGYMRVMGNPVFIDDHGFDLSKLVCYGCCHSRANGEYPGSPSGERPCCFCVRNHDWPKAQKEIKKRTGKELKVWYDGTPVVRYPMDCYHSLDMLEQISKR